MTVYLVERELGSMRLEHFQAAQVALIEAARRLSSNGRHVRYLRSTFAAGGRCYCIFEATGPDLVRLANQTAQLPFSRIQEAVDLPAPAGL